MGRIFAASVARQFRREQIMREPSKAYVAVLDIKAIIRQWQDRDVTDVQALTRIQAILDAERITP